MEKVFKIVLAILILLLIVGTVGEKIEAARTAKASETVIAETINDTFAEAGAQDTP